MVTVESAGVSFRNLDFMRPSSLACPREIAISGASAASTVLATVNISRMMILRFFIGCLSTVTSSMVRFVCTEEPAIERDG